MFSEIIFAYHGVDMPTMRVECEKPQENRIRGETQWGVFGSAVSKES